MTDSEQSPEIVRIERTGMKRFLVLLIGRTVSIFGSNLAGFALGVWIYQTTHSATQFAITSTLAVLPGIVLMPFAGAIVDRWDRRHVIIAADAVAGVSALALGLLFYFNLANTWTIASTLAVGSACQAFRWPAVNASIPLMVPKRHLSRAAGLQQTGMAIGQILAPLLGAALLGFIGVWGIVMINCASFLFAIATILPLEIPSPPKSSENLRGRSLRDDIVYGWHYIQDRPGLMGLLILFAGTNFALGTAEILLTPLVLSFGTAKQLSVVLFVAGLGTLAGGLAMGIWGGPRRKVVGIFTSLFVEGALLMLSGIRPSIPLIAATVLLAMASIQVGQACSQAIWQVKVAPDVQGRVFSTRSMIATITQPVAFMLAGPLADFVFEPLFMPDGALASSLGRAVGVGAGRGIGFMFVIMGVLMLAAATLGLRSRRLRFLEEDLPDAIDDVSPASLRRAIENEPAGAPST